jgi:hypothetical protein
MHLDIKNWLKETWCSKQLTNVISSLTVLRKVKPLVPADMQVVSTHQSALDPRLSAVVIFITIGSSNGDINWQVMVESTRYLRIFMVQSY